MNTTASFNSAFGNHALRSNTTGGHNSAVGNRALSGNTTGNHNAAIGHYALRGHSSGDDNSAFGHLAMLFHSTGSENVAIGSGALFSNNSGSRNVAIGRYAGSQSLGNDNIYLANQGVSGDDAQIKIGTVGTHTGTTIAGIHTATSSGGIAVLVNASGKLGTTTSSARFKRDVQDMRDASAVLMKLRPVVFHYREEAVGAEEAGVPQFGLIAEEVATVAPDLVASDLEGKPYSVRYHVLAPMLLNEMQKQHHTIAGQVGVIEAQQAAMRIQEEEIAALTKRLARLEARD